MMKKLIVIILTSVCIFLVYGNIEKVYDEIYDMNNLENGIYVESFFSPNNDYVLNLYKCKSNVNTKCIYRIEIEFLDTGNKKNIYFNECKNSIKVRWKENNIVIINGRELNVYKDEYDFRQESRL